MTLNIRSRLLLVFALLLATGSRSPSDSSDAQGSGSEPSPEFVHMGEVDERGGKLCAASWRTTGSTRIFDHWAQSSNSTRTRMNTVSGTGRLFVGYNDSICTDNSGAFTIRLQ
jgi:hypothetical protein